MSLKGAKQEQHFPIVSNFLSNIILKLQYCSLSKMVAAKSKKIHRENVTLGRHRIGVTFCTTKSMFT